MRQDRAVNADRWHANWIGPDPDPREDLGVFAFRCRLVLREVPASLPVRVTADQRYRMTVNGEFVGRGPDRGDPLRWRYREYDLAPYLREGVNHVAAAVWNFGRWAPMAQHSARTGFLLEALGHPGLSTPGGWQVARLPGWHFDMMHSGIGEFYIDVGPGEILDAIDLPWGWETGDEDGDALDWRDPHGICVGTSRGASGGGTPWCLVPSPLPPQNETPFAGRPERRRGFAGDDDASAHDLEGGWTLRPGAPIVLDFGELLCAYPRIVATGAEGATLVLTYAEAPWSADGSKGDRNDVRDKEIRGYQDRFILDGRKRTFETIWWRTFRYVQVELTPPGGEEVAASEAVFELTPIETGYPYTVESRFEADDPVVGPTWEVGVRTLRRCAGETYFDCPYYEQLQYVGDSRIQALAGYYLSRDRRLQRSAIDQIGDSVMADGLTQSRYPSRQTQVIPPFSLWWILMLHDQWRFDPSGPREEHLKAAEGVLAGWDRLCRRPEAAFWCFADWVPEWPMGEPPGGPLATVHRLTEWLARVALHEMRGGRAADLRAGVEREFPAGPTSRHRDDPSEAPSAHAEALWRVLQRRIGLEVAPWPSDALARAPRCTYYFDFYRHEALLPEDYLAELGPWRDMISAGLTTFAENPEPTRSDCHAWSAHPVLGLLRHVAGIDSGAPGWARIRAEPKPGRLTRFEARVAHPAGDFVMVYREGRLSGSSPVHVDLVWRGETKSLPAGSFEV